MVLTRRPIHAMEVWTRSGILIFQTRDIPPEYFNSWLIHCSLYHFPCFSSSPPLENSNPNMVENSRVHFLRKNAWWKAHDKWLDGYKVAQFFAESKKNDRCITVLSYNLGIWIQKSITLWTAYMGDLLEADSDLVRLPLALNHSFSEIFPSRLVEPD